VSNDVLEVAETVSARRVLVIRARPFRYAVVTLVATADVEAQGAIPHQYGIGSEELLT
jgi:hypothetical protein